MEEELKHEEIIIHEIVHHKKSDAKKYSTAPSQHRGRAFLVNAPENLDDPANVSSKLEDASR